MTAEGAGATGAGTQRRGVRRAGTPRGARALPCSFARRRGPANGAAEGDRLAGAWSPEADPQGLPEDGAPTAAARSLSADLGRAGRGATLARPPCSCSIRRMSRESLGILILIRILIQIQNMENGVAIPTLRLCIVWCQILGRGNRGSSTKGLVRVCICNGCNVGGEAAAREEAAIGGAAHAERIAGTGGAGIGDDRGRALKAKRQRMHEGVLQARGAPVSSGRTPPG